MALLLHHSISSNNSFDSGAQSIGIDVDEPSAEAYFVQGNERGPCQ